MLCADAPEGPFKPVKNGAVTPKDWECLDGTLYFDEESHPWMVFSMNGARSATELSAVSSFQKISKKPLPSRKFFSTLPMPLGPFQTMSLARKEM